MVHDDPDHVGRSTIADAAAAGEGPKARRVGVLALARRLGVNPRTIYKWLERGAPASLDESAVRAWAIAQGMRDLRPSLALSAPDVPQGTHQPATDAPAAAGAEGKPGQATDAPVPEGGWSPAQRKADADAKLSDERRRKVQLEIAELERRLVDRADLLKITIALSTVFVHALNDLPAASVRVLDQLPAEWRRPMRRAIEQSIEGLRGQLERALRAELASVLRGPGVVRDG